MKSKSASSFLLTVSLVSGLLGLTSSTAQAAAPAGANFVVTADDLRFIMTQIKISEAHATQLANPGYTAGGQPIVTPWSTPLVDASTVATDIPNPDLPWGLRQVDGRNNNLTNTAGVPSRGEWGAADTPFPRMTSVRWRANYATRTGNITDADPRLISNLIVDQSECNPAARTAANNGTTYVPCGVAASIASATANGTYITFVTSSPHSLTNGVSVTITGVTPNGFNVSGTVTVLDPKSFSITNGLANGSSATNTAGVLTVVPAVGAPSTKARFETDQPIVNHSPNGSTAPSSGIFTIFGQFFDHGLDLVGKSATDIVFVPLKSDDPLYVSGGPTNFMAMSRTILGTGGAGDNSTTPYVDQNQTYTSIASHQAFLRRYLGASRTDLTATSVGPKTTGEFLDGSAGGLATWADIKNQSKTQLGITLGDTDIFNVPNLLTNEFGKFLPGPHGFPMMAVTPAADTTKVVFLEGDPRTNITTTGNAPVDIYDSLGTLIISVGQPYKAVLTGHAFLNDINHCAVPGSDAQSTSDCKLNGQNSDFTGPASSVTTPPTVPFITPAFANYSPSLLESHFITGDGRGNENIALTAIHTVFHSEHNRLINDPALGYKKVIADEAQSVALTNSGTAVTYLQDWVNETIPNGATITWVGTDPSANGTPLTWNGEHLFQAARFTMEMEYQHLVFAEFLRMVEPAIAPFAGYDINVRSDVYAEFAHAVYRYGHSQLTDMVNRTAYDATTNTYTDYSDSLLNSFLNPAKFNTGPTGPISADVAVGGIARGMSAQTGSEIDEFVTSDLRNSLLGIPLDLATINIARGRDAGIGSLNQVRRDLKLKTYANWFDFGNSLRHPESLVNFIAAYATSDTALGLTVVNEPSINGKRGAAQDILTSFRAGDAAAASFMFGLNGANGVDSIDLWVGGLAESPKVCLAAACPLLGETFSTVFRKQMEDLQAGDRLYYLSRLAGLNLGLQVESNTLSEMIQRNSDAQNLPALIMTTADYSVVSKADPVNPNPANPNNCPTFDVRDLRTNLSASGIALMISDLGCRLQYIGTSRKNVVYGGSDSQGDNIMAGNGDDTVRGNGGNDLVNAGDGNNQIYGGDGNDVLIDEGNSSSVGVLNGGDGNDVLLPGNGLKGNNPGRGDDVVISGVAPAVALMGLGDDKFLGNDTGNDTATGDDGSDWLEGHGGLDGLTGDAAAVFGIDTVKFGSDYLWGGSANDVLDGGGASDILGEGDGGAGSDTMTGGFGWDWVTAQGSTAAASYDGLCGNLVPLTPIGGPGVVQCPAGLVDAFIDEVEGMVGSPHDDYMRGGDALTFASNPLIANSSNDLIGSDFWTFDTVTATVRVPNGLATILGIAQPVDNSTAITPARTGNILLGGGGSDTLMGGGGNDYIYGDATQLVKLRVQIPGSSPVAYAYVQSMNDLVGSTGKTARDMLIDQTLDPKDLVPVTNYNVGTVATDVDTAVFSRGIADYSYTKNADGSITVTQGAVNGGGITADDSDTLYGIEQLKFLNLATTGIATTTSISNGVVPSAPFGVAAASTGPTSALVSWTVPTYPNTVFAGAITSYTVAATLAAANAGLPITSAAGDGTRIRYTVSNPGGVGNNQIVTGDIVTVFGFVNGQLNLTNAVVSAATAARVDILSTSTATEGLGVARIVKARVSNTANAATRSVTLTGLTQDTTYNVAVRANTTVARAPLGGDFSANVSVTPVVPPAPALRNPAPFSPPIPDAVVAPTVGGGEQISVTASVVAQKNTKYSVFVTFPHKFKLARATLTIRDTSGKKVASHSTFYRNKSTATLKMKLPKKMKSGEYWATVTVRAGWATYTISQTTIHVE